MFMHTQAGGQAMRMANMLPDFVWQVLVLVAAIVSAWNAGYATAQADARKREDKPCPK